MTAKEIEQKLKEVHDLRHELKNECVNACKASSVIALKKLIAEKDKELEDYLID